MSNYQLPPNTNLVLAPEWAALAKIGKVFHWVYILIICSLLFIILLVAGGVVAGFPASEENPETLFEEHVLFGLFFLLGIVILGIWSVIVGILMLVRMWSTPESIVPGGGIGRTYVVLALVAFCFGFCAGILKEINPQVSQLLKGCCNICGFIGFILFLVYVYRLGNAIGSQRVKSCIKWVVYGGIGCFVLIFLTGVLGAMETPIAGITGIAFFLLGLVAFLSYLNSFGYLAKDIKAFIEKHLQEYANAINTPNQPEEGTEF